MLLPTIVFAIILKIKKNIYFVVISLNKGWLWIKISDIILLYFVFNTNNNYLFKNVKINSYLNYFLGFFLPYTKLLKLFGTGYKLTDYNFYFFLRNNLSHKTLIILFKNIKCFLVKKTVFILQSRKLDWIQNTICNLRVFCNKNNYKKKGIFYKNEVLFLKIGKVVKN